MHYRVMEQGLLLGLIVLAGTGALANGGPFIVEYPDGDPAAKGVLARLDPDLKPARETRLKVVKEDLSLTYNHQSYGWGGTETPLVDVRAEYKIQNPTKETIEVDFGFPVVRGIYTSPFSMMRRPRVHVSVDGEHIRNNLISNSAIYGIIRARARETIRKGILDDAKLTRFIKNVRTAQSGNKARARKKLIEYLKVNHGWEQRDAVLLAAFAEVKLGKATDIDENGNWFQNEKLTLRELPRANLGTLSAIGEKKATQLLALLAGRFDPQSASGYEAIFSAWGGDVRERSVDLQKGHIRPREVSVPSNSAGDPTIYARVDYMEKNGRLSRKETKACKRILKNLPVIFTFAPMNLLHYRVEFPPHSTRIVAVEYGQRAYVDSRGPKSYQMSYVIHPASLWREFGPINLTVNAPDGVKIFSSVPCKNGSTFEKDSHEGKVKYASCKAVIEDKTGELFLGVGARQWDKVAAALEER